MLARLRDALTEAAVDTTQDLFSNEARNNYDAFLHCGRLACLWGEDSNKIALR